MYMNVYLYIHICENPHIYIMNIYACMFAHTHTHKYIYMLVCVLTYDDGRVDSDEDARLELGVQNRHG